MKRKLISYARGKEAFVAMPDTAADLRDMCDSDETFSLVLQQLLALPYMQRLKELEQTEDIEGLRVYTLRFERGTAPSSTRSVKAVIS